MVNKGASSVLIRREQFADLAKQLQEFSPVHYNSSLVPEDTMEYENEFKLTMVNFVHTLIDNGDVKAEAKMFLQAYRDSLAEFMDVESINEMDMELTRPVNELIKKLVKANNQATESLNNQRVEILKSIEGVESSDLEIGQRFIITCENFEFSCSWQLALIVGKCLGYREAPASESWIHAGKSFILRTVCGTISNKLNIASDMVPGDDIAELEDDALDSTNNDKDSRKIAGIIF
jgi:hypothetical protein